VPTARRKRPNAYTGRVTALLSIGAALVALAIWIYNRLVSDRNQVRSAWSDIDVQLALRHDLVPRLVASVKAYADYEKATLTAVTELRLRSEVASRLADKAAVEEQLEAGLHRLLVVAEDYPDLQADEGFRQLHVELTEVEDHLQYARRFYNGAVRILNTRIESFPHFLVASRLGFRQAEFFEVAGAEVRSTPPVELAE
jgi:LemA protein